MEYNKSIHLFCDNRAAINIAKNSVHHDHTKHVEIDRHFISDKVEGKIVSLIYTPTLGQGYPPLTKGENIGKHKYIGNSILWIYRKYH